MNYKNHIVGPNYTIHGNILLGQKVLDSMEARFKRAKGDLACKLMAAMQGAKMVGADTRCANNNTSSLFAFLKVMQPTDTFGKPSFIVSLKTHNGDSIEPIDSLQKLFSAKRTCTVISVGAIEKIKPVLIDIFPNPAGGMIKAKAAGAAHISFIDITGRIVLERDFEDEISIDTTILTQGIYLATVSSGETRLTRRIVISGM
jgi:hypothetical protein